MELESRHITSGIEWEIEPEPWPGFGFLSKLIAFGLPLLAAVTIILPFLDHYLLRRLARLPGLGGLVDWLINSNGSWLAGIALLLIWVGFLLFKRWRMVSNEHLWVDAGCPQCQEHELVRVSRVRSDRWYGLLRIPAFRYACRNCTFRGLRIARRHRHIVLAQEDLITASSLTVDAYFPDQTEEVGVAEAVVTEAAVTEAVVTDMSVEEPVVHDMVAQDLAYEETAQDPETAAALAAAATAESDIESGASQRGGNEEDQSEDMTASAPVESQIEPAPPDDDDLDWLWRKLSEEV